MNAETTVRPFEMYQLALTVVMDLIRYKGKGVSVRENNPYGDQYLLELVVSALKCFLNREVAVIETAATFVVEKHNSLQSKLESPPLKAETVRDLQEVLVVIGSLVLKRYGEFSYDLRELHRQLAIKI